ncbi:TadE/TadG family type IV pilus assembly protein [Streptacidiphilus sp. EB129]|uniref:TadE/TadG family type IV pilus assembly protein n=1 Tax=Streptacidiphilus sp. EB129 TaxID=3156262 RepID=UPI003516351B
MIGDRHARTADRGALSLELAFLAPVVMLLLFTTIQAGLFLYARDVALTAAQQGVEAARVQGASLSDGEARTWDLLQRTGGSITGQSVTTSSGTQVQITVTGHVDTWIPGLSLPLSQTATGAKEVPAP